MNSTSSISQSGMLAASEMLRASANNIANINTDGFKKDIARPEEIANGGVKTLSSKSSLSSTVFRADIGDTVETSNVRMEEEMVNQITAKHQFSANLSALKTNFEAEREVLDIIA